MFVASIVVFCTTYFALAENQSMTANNLFLDSDQDGLTNQEEKMIGTDPYKSDTDSDGYSDGAEVQSGYNPLKPAPGDKLFPGQNITSSNSAAENSSSSTSGASADGNSGEQGTSSGTDLASLSANLLGSLDASALDSQTTDATSTDPNNLTSQVINNFMQLTLDKTQDQTDTSSSLSYSTDDISQIIENSLSSTDISKDLPVISDSDIKLLPPVEGKNLTVDEKKAKEKAQIQKYLASMAFIFATNAPFPVTDTSNFLSTLQSEQSTVLSALTSGNQTKMDDYAERSSAAISQIKEVEVPDVMKDLHKSALQLSLYTLEFKDKLAIDPNDPLKNLAAFGALQSVSESAMKLQDQLSSIMSDYGITEIEISK